MSDSYPKTLHLFKKWARAMEEGAVVDRPRYSTSSTRKVFKKKTRSAARKRRRRFRKKRRSHGKD